MRYPEDWLVCGVIILYIIMVLYPLIAVLTTNP